MATSSQAEAEKAEWVASAPGLAIDPDNSYGLQCKDVADQYGIDLFQVGLFVALKGGDAMTVLDGANSKYYDVIRNDPKNPNLLPRKGDVIVWGGSASNPYGHVAVVQAADKDGVTVVQQDGFKAPLKAFYFSDGTVRYYSQHPTHVERLGYWNAGTGMVAGWLRPKPGVVVYSGADKRGYGKVEAPQASGNYRLEVRENFPGHTDASAVRSVFGFSRPVVPVSDVIHWWGDPATNPTFDGVCTHFERQTAAGVGAHYVLEAGRVRRGIAEADASHANGHSAANAQTVTWECNPRCSAGDRETLAQALADAWVARGMTRPGVVEMHKDYHATACPGAYERYLPEIRERAAALFNAKRSGKVTTQSVAPAGGSDPIEELFGVKRGTKEYNDVVDDIAKAVWSYKNPKDPDKTDAFGRLTRTYKGLESVAAAVSAKRIALAVWGYTNEKVNGKLDAYGMLTTVNRNTVKEQGE